MSEKEPNDDPFAALFAQAVEAVEKNKRSTVIDIELDDGTGPVSENDIELDLEVVTIPDISDGDSLVIDEDSYEDNDASFDETDSDYAAPDLRLEDRILDLETEVSKGEEQLIKAKKMILRRKSENAKLKDRLESLQKELIQHRMLQHSAQNRLDVLTRRITDAEEARDQNSSRVLQLQTVLDQTKERLSKEQHFRNKENEETTKFGGMKIVRNLLPALDNLQLALKHRENNLETFANGISMIEHQFIGILNGMGLTEITAEVGQIFDPNVHEAVVSIPTDAQEPNTIVEVLRSGYALHERLMRATRVSVAAESTTTIPPPQIDESQEEDADFSSSDE
jgi:molecular chaperone GrpE